MTFDVACADAPRRRRPTFKKRDSIMAITVPESTRPGSAPWIAATVKLARSWSERSERDVRQLVGYVADLRKHGHVADWQSFCREVIGYEADYLAAMETGVSILEKRAATETALEQALNAWRRMSAAERADFMVAVTKPQAGPTQAERNRARVGPRDLKDPRSREYAIQTVSALKTYVRMKSADEERVHRELEEIRKYRHWEVLGYASEGEMLATELEMDGGK
ncbi:MAG TPA: hypothetical protein VH475_01045 [Tepidisphaeraceae bacterium]|jgi:hypothetical protein